MTEPFDPYRKWLGIPPHEQPPTHYRLLGIGPFEDDPDVIENAANRQMAHVRTFQTGRYSKLSQRILNELSAARLCLLNPDKKREYDEQLRSQTDPAPPPPVVPPSRGAPPGPAAPAVPRRSRASSRPVVKPRRSRGSRTSASRRHRRPVRRRSSSLPIILGLILAAILIGVLIVVLNTDWKSRSRDNSMRQRDSAALTRRVPSAMHHGSIHRPCHRLCLA